MIDIAVSFLTALLAGMGVGGGGLLVLYLVFIKDMGQTMAQGLNLVVFIFAALSSLVYHRKKRRIDTKTCLLLCVFGVIGAIVGSLAAYGIKPALLRKLFGWLLIISGTVSAFKLRKK